MRGSFVVGDAPMSAKDLPMERGPITWPILLLTLATGGYVVYRYDQERRNKLESFEKQTSIGKAALGGPFELVSQDGAKFTGEAALSPLQCPPNQPPDDVL